VGLPILGFLGVAAVSAVLSVYPAQSRQWLVVLCTYAVLLYLVVFFLRRWNHVLVLLGTLAIMGGLEAGLALVQGLWFGKLRPTGTFFNPNFLAGYLAAILTLLLGVVAFGRYEKRSWFGVVLDVTGFVRWTGTRLSCHERESVRTSRDDPLPLPPDVRSGQLRCHWTGAAVAGAVVLFGVMIAALLWTGSRGGLLALLVGGATVLVLRSGWRGMLVIVAIVGIATLLPTPWRDRVFAEHQQNPVAYARLQMWQQAVRMMIDHPFGVGLGLYQYVSPRYAFPVEQQVARYAQIARTPHSELAQIGAELGVIGLLLFVWGAVEVARRARAALRLRLGRWQRGVIVGVIGAMASILVHAVVDSNLHEPPIAMLLVLSVAVILVAPRLASRDSRPEPALVVRRPWVWQWTGGATLITVGCAVVLLGAAWLFYEAGGRALDRGDLGQAMAHFQRATELDPGKALYHSALGAVAFRVFQQTQDVRALTTSLAEVRKAIDCNPLDGRLRAISGEVAMAIASRSHLIRTPKERRTWLLVARDAYTDALRLMPYAVFERLALAKVLWTLEEKDAAERLIREAVDLEPNFLPGRAFLVRLYLGRQHEHQKAQNEYQEIVNRQRRYPIMGLAPFERRYLEVDVATLTSALKQAGIKLS
jgi:O-antigen ligase